MSDACIHPEVLHTQGTNPFGFVGKPFRIAFRFHCTILEAFFSCPLTVYFFGDRSHSGFGFSGHDAASCFTDCAGNAVVVSREPFCSTPVQRHVAVAPFGKCLCDSIDGVLFCMAIIGLVAAIGFVDCAEPAPSMLSHSLVGACVEAFIAIAPLYERFSSTVKLDNDICPFIAILLFRSCPTNVSRCVTLFVLASIKAMFAARSFSNLFEKGFKRVEFKRNASPAIVVIVRMRFVVASLFGAVVGGVLWRSVHAMSAVSSAFCVRICVSHLMLRESVDWLESRSHYQCGGFRYFTAA